ncbi:methyltransferase, FxLD system [Streptomyces mobaraensis]|uniref:methyltransferase, FxLD system n=1 Tax=Streptomyces mobaraensis TaxID=35621 RepID=UPI0033165E35
MNKNAAEEAERLREEVIKELWALDAIRSDAVEAAFRTVPREAFIPGEPLEDVYAAEKAIVTKVDRDGTKVSSVSAARIQAFMLEQAGLRPGMRVLEVGSGGLNAAYLAEMVGPDGEVTTIDIDPEITDRARRLLASAGYGDRVTILTADAEHGGPERAPYDRVVVTVEAPDIPPAWVKQLAPGGRLVVPLRLRGLTRSIAFEVDGERLVSTGYELCGFVPMRGAGANRVRTVTIHDEGVTLRLDEDRQVEAAPLAEALLGERAEAWSGVTIGRMQSWAELDLWLATALDGFAILSADSSAHEKEIVTARYAMALVEGDSFAYRILRRIREEPPLFEFGAVGHGPSAQATAERLVGQVRVWDLEHRPGQAHFEVWPAGTPGEALPPGRVVDKRHTRIVVSWAGDGPGPG